MTCPKPNTFSEGDIVFVKLKGYRHWPARITEISKSNKGLKKYTTKFYGDDTCATVNVSDIFPYVENINTFGTTLVDNFKNKNFNKALREAEWELKTTATAENSPTQTGPVPLPGSTEGDKSDLTTKNKNKQSNNNVEFQLNSSIKELELSIIENNLLDNAAEETTTLEMAGKIGSALLSENNLLKEKNLRLQADLLLLEENIEKMRESELRYIERAERLQDQLITTENQLKKEIQLRKEAQNIFEAHDDKLQLQLNEYMTKIKDQEKLIITLKAEIRSLDVAVESDDKMEQTSSNEPQNLDKEIRNDDTTSQTNSFLLNELIQLRMRQEKIESTVNNLLEEQLSQTSNTKDPAIPYANRADSPRPHSVKTPQTFRQDKHTRISDKKRTNVFSVSLQVTKFKDSTKHQKQQKTNQACDNNTPVVEEKVVSSPKKSISSIDSQPNGLLIPDMLNIHSIKAPPITAKLLMEGESWEDFFENNLEHYKIVNANYFNSSSPKTSDKAQTPFLGYPINPLITT